ncbi:MAG: hypothetical protein ABH811_02170 [archaeon]
MKKGLMIICVILLIVLYIVNINFLLFKKSVSLTGSGIVATVALQILSLADIVTIYSPLNQTYDFSIGETYTLDLNVSANFDVDSWSYDLWDLKHNIKVNDSIAFSPNTTFDAVRWSNKIVVKALKSSGETISSNVTFFINVPNSAPFFGPINSSISVCEDSSLSYYFNVTDVDEEVLQLVLTPTNPFYLDTIFTSASVQRTKVELFSGTIRDSVAREGDEGWKIYDEKIEVTDQVYSDTAYTNITAIRINDAPVVSTIGVQTVYTRGDDSTFYKQVDVTDEEDGDQDAGNLGFNISFLNSAKLFNISDEGIMNFSPIESQVGVYNITVCVNDTGINNPHENISICGQDGGVITTCKNFSLTVTNENRAPTITDYNPADLTLNESGTDSLNFNITKYDPDGTIPDAYWYVGGVFKEYDSGSFVDTFTYNFGCGVSGNKVVKAEITDGLLNDSIEWTVSVNLVECEVPSSGGGGGGGGGGVIPSCKEKWACMGWSVCQNVDESLKEGLLSGEDYRKMIGECASNHWSGSLCGVQTRICFDSNFCNTTYFKPFEFQGCAYTEAPSCNDGIKNCHDNACELLIDCGGPCPACPSCSDKIQNQGEEEIDCGGPCPWRCEVEVAFYKKISIWYIFLLLLILLILIILIIKKIRKIIEHRRLLS